MLGQAPMSVSLCVEACASEGDPRQRFGQAAHLIQERQSPHPKALCHPHMGTPAYGCPSSPRAHGLCPHGFCSPVIEPQLASTAGLDS